MQSTAAPPSDEELMRLLCSAADRQTAERAFHEVFQRYHGRVVSWCYRIAKDRDTSRDLAQDVFLKAYRHRHSFRGEARLSTWLYAIARNHCLTSVRRTDADAIQVDPAICLTLPDPTCAAPDRAAEQNQRATRLLGLMLRILEPMEVRVMTLHYAHEIPLAAITRDLDLRNPSGAKAYIVNARRKLLGLLRRGTAAC
jgi:RNA polymerase sigma-70 factor (ECF subfamily)